MFEKIINIEKNQEERLDVFLLDKLDLNRSQIKKYIKEEKILVNNSAVKAGYKLVLGDIISVKYEDKIVLKPLKMDLDILYEDEDIAVISKPQNLAVHPGTGHMEDTLVNALLYNFKTLAKGSGELRPGIVHRLDKDTSGLMIIAKTDIAFEKLVEMFKNGEIDKEYLAICEGEFLKDEGIIDEPIGRNPNNRIKMKVIYENSKKAITKYEVLEKNEELTLVKVKLLTGRMHQIRVHMSYIGYPVLGDLVYGRENRYNIKTQMLHAYHLEFNHPITGKKLEIIDHYPKRFKRFFNKEVEL